MMEFALLALGCVAGGLAGLVVRQLLDGKKTAKNPPRDRVAEIERAIQTYRAEVTDLQDLVERRYRREQKREERAKKAAEESTEESAGFPQGEGGEDDLLLRANLARFMKQ